MITSKLTRLLLIVWLLFVVVAYAPPAAHASTREDGVVVHMVRKGETLTSIATKYGITAQAIARYNGISVSKRLITNARLKIPLPSPKPTPKPTPVPASEVPPILPTTRPQNDG